MVWKPETAEETEELGKFGVGKMARFTGQETEAALFLPT
jgi:hypothetical protein